MLWSHWESLFFFERALVTKQSKYLAQYAQFQQKNWVEFSTIFFLQIYIFQKNRKCTVNTTISPTNFQPVEKFSLRKKLAEKYLFIAEFVRNQS